MRYILKPICLKLLCLQVFIIFYWYLKQTLNVFNFFDEALVTVKIVADISKYNGIRKANFSQFLKARSNGSNMLVKHYPTLLGGVGRVWSVLNAGVFNESNTIQQCWISVYQERNYDVFLITRTKMSDAVGCKVWTKLNFIKRRPTLSNMFDCAVQTGQTCCVQHEGIFTTTALWIHNS